MQIQLLPGEKERRAVIQSTSLRWRFTFIRGNFESLCCLQIFWPATKNGNLHSKNVIS